MNYLALMRLLYRIDREALWRFRRPIAGNAVVTRKQRLVLSAIFDRVSQKKPHLPGSARHNFIPRPGPYVYTVRYSGVPEISALSPAAVALIEEIFARHWACSAEDLVELTRGLPAWTDPGKTSPPIPFETI